MANSATPLSRQIFTRAEICDNHSGGLAKALPKATTPEISVWKTGFWGEKASGWHYDLIFVLMNLLIAFTNGGAYVLMP